MTTVIPVASPELKPSGSDKIWAMLCHLSILLGVGYFIFPLVVYLAMKDDSPFVADHSREALNFHISIAIYGLVSALLCFVLVGFLLLAIIGLATIIFAIVAAIKVSENKTYRYPLTIRFIS